MIEVFHLKENQARPITSQTLVEVGDTLLIAGKEETIPFIRTKKDVRLHILLISPIGTIIDSTQVCLDDTGLRRIYAFPITPELFSGSYILQINGDIRRCDKINIKTTKQLLYRWILSYGISFTNPNNFPLNNFMLDVMIPPNISPIQQVTNVVCNYQPSGLVGDQEGNRWLRFYFHQINPNEEVTLAYRAFIITRLVAYDITRIKEQKESFEHLYQNTYKEYTKSESFIESTNESIVNIARKFKSYSPLGKVFNFLKFIKNNIDYIPLDGDYGSVFAIENRYGDCTEFASLFVSLCRAANIPARMTSCIINNGLEGWQYHSQAEFFINGIWLSIDPTLLYDVKYLHRDPSCIILQRGNSFGDSAIREIRYRFDDMNNREIILRSHKEAVYIKNRIIGKISETSIKELKEAKGTLFENISWKFSLPSLDLEEQANEIKIKVITPETAPIHKPFSVPVHLFNKNDEKIIGTLRISFVRGGIFTSHLHPMELNANSHETKMIEIPATNFLGKTLIDFIFQDENGLKLGYDQKRIHFQ